MAEYRTPDGYRQGYYCAICGKTLGILGHTGPSARCEGSDNELVRKLNVLNNHIFSMWLETNNYNWPLSDDEILLINLRYGVDIYDKQFIKIIHDELTNSGKWILKDW